MTEGWVGEAQPAWTLINIPRINILGFAYLHRVNQSKSVSSSTPVKPITEKEPGNHELSKLDSIC